MSVQRSAGVAAQASWIDPVARAGYATRGIVYLVIGAFAVFAAFGPTDAEGTEGAFGVILSQPFGQILLWLVVVGMAGFAVWRFVQAWHDPDGHGTGAKGLAMRGGKAVSGIVHVGLAGLAAAMVLGWNTGGDGGGSDPTGRWIAAIYDAGFGQLLTWTVAGLVAVVAAAQIWKGYTAAFEPQFRECPPDIMRWVRPLGRVGYTARGITFLVIASLIFYGGLRYGGMEGGSTPGLADALNSVEGYSYGWLILLAIALGLLAFGLFSLAAARYRRMVAS
ncbi:MAG: DUF1206 domain-containing protein [Gammaproteobacteria bacterium]